MTKNFVPSFQERSSLPEAGHMFFFTFFISVNTVLKSGKRGSGILFRYGLHPAALAKRRGCPAGENVPLLAPFLWVPFLLWAQKKWNNIT